MDSAKKKVTLSSLYNLSEKYTNAKFFKAMSIKHQDWQSRLKTMSSEIEALKTQLKSPHKDMASLDANCKAVFKKWKVLFKSIQKTQKSFAKKRTDIQS